MQIYEGKIRSSNGATASKISQIDDDVETYVFKDGLIHRRGRRSERTSSAGSTMPSRLRMILHHLDLIRIRRESEEGRTADPQIATKACSADVCRGDRPMPPRAPTRENSKPHRGSRFGGSKPQFSKTDCRENSGETVEKQRAATARNSGTRARSFCGFAS